MKTFKDLEFKPKTHSPGYQAKIHFENGYGASVIFGGYSYGAPNTPYEIAVLKGDRICYDTPVTDDVIGWLDEDGVTEILEQIQNLEKVTT